MTISEIQRKLNALIDLVKDEDKVLILMHDNPDPDSIASALGLQYILEQLAKKPSLIGYAGIVGRAENRAMLKYLGIKLCSLSRISLPDVPCVAMVDTQPSTGNNFRLSTPLCNTLSFMVMQSWQIWKRLQILILSLKCLTS